MRKHPIVYIDHILESIEAIEVYTKGLSIQKFLADQKTHDAAVRRIEIIGEATRNIPKPVKNKYPEVEWKQINNMRNVLIHEYDGVDLNEVWDVAVKDIKILKKQMLKIKKDIQPR